MAFFTDLGRFPEASDSAHHPAVYSRSRWEESGCETALQKTATCTRPTTLPSFSTATACRSKEFSSSTAQQSFVDLSTRIRGMGGGLNCEVKAQVLVVTPPPPLFPGSRSQKGGGVIAGQYVRISNQLSPYQVRTHCQ